VVGVGMFGESGINNSLKKFGHECHWISLDIGQSDGSTFTFLMSGLAMADFWLLGNLPWVMEVLHIKVMNRATVSQASLSSHVGIGSPEDTAGLVTSLSTLSLLRR